MGKCQMGKFKMSNGKCQMGMSNGNVKWEMSNGKNVKWDFPKISFTKALDHFKRN